ncbi:MAG TPA: kynureninase [Acetobacteraceae bacterium]|nr:kynureninase [Acetobacteraceae bacterium]
MTITREDCAARDHCDRLAMFRDRFVLPPGVIYLDGNSLGPLPRATPARLLEVAEIEWGTALIRAWNRHDWIGLPRRVGEKIARLIGAPPGSTIVADSTSVNVFKALAAALALRPERRVMVSEAGNFPTDLYVAQGLAALLGRGHTLRRVEDDDIAAAIDADVAAVLLTHVDYRSGRMLDMAAITRAAHAAGAVVIWDLAHSAGAVPLDLAKCDVDFAIGCGYKYLNGGPGAPAFLHVAPRLLDAVAMPLTGWLGHADPFAFDGDFRAAPGIARGQVGTPAVLSLAALEVGVDLALEAPEDAVRAKSLALTGLFAGLVAQECGDFGFECITPAEEVRRGSQVSFRHPEGYAIMQALIARGVIGDFRAPDVLRFGCTPLTLRHADVWDAVAILREVMQMHAYRAPEFRVRHAVT